jgi:hypothetical protein
VAPSPVNRRRTDANELDPERIQVGCTAGVSRVGRGTLAGQFDDQVIHPADAAESGVRGDDVPMLGSEAGQVK